MTVSDTTVNPFLPPTDYHNPVDHALHLASLGFRVFRLRPNSKAAMEGWQSEATDNAAQIRALWRMMPDAGVGLAMGNGWVAIDLDKKPDRDGLQSLCNHLNITEFELLEMTRVHLTPSGGRHLIFRCEGAFGNSVNLLSGVDVRGEGGYIAGPGTIIHGVPYAVESDIPAQPLPVELARFLKQSRDRDPKSQEPLAEWDRPENISRAREFLKMRPPAIEGNGGNDHTYATACLVRDMCISESMCIELMTEPDGWNDHCQPPWGSDELSTVVQNAYAYGKDRPGTKALIIESFDDSEYFAANDNDPEPEKSKPRFIVQSESMQDDTSDIEYLMDRILPVQSVGMIYAAEMSFKTFMAMDMVLCGAAGIPWAKGDGHAGFMPIRPLKTIFIAGEGARGIAKKRRPAWRQHHGIRGQLPFYTVPEMPRMTSDDDVGALIESIRSSHCPNPDIIVIDTVAVAMTGAEENSVMDTGILIAHCRKLIREFECTVLLIHHSGKDEKKGSRGSTNLPYSCDFRYRVGPAAGSTPEQPIVKIKQEKMKDEELLPLMIFQGQKVAESLAFERVSSVKTKGGVFTDAVEIVAEALETIPKGKEVAASFVARHAVSGGLPGITEAALLKRIQRDMNKEETRRPYNHLIKEKPNGAIVFVGQQEADEEDAEIRMPDI